MTDSYNQGRIISMGYILALAVINLGGRSSYLG